jgi:ABC-type branched-subunit amino acid transport system substrate-binding protein
MEKRKAFVKCFGLTFLVILSFFGTAGITNAEKPSYGIGHVAMLTGAYGPTMAGNNEGFLDAIEAANTYWNLPVTIKPVWVDGASAPAKALSACKKMVEQFNPVVLVDDTTPTSLAIKGYVMSKKIPALSGGGADPLWALPSWSFSVTAPYTNQCGAWVDYYLKNMWPKKNLKRKPNFAFVTWDNAAGRASITDKVKDYIRSKGVNIVPGDGEFIPGDAMELGAQMLRLKSNQVDFTYGMLMHSQASAMLKSADKHGMIDNTDFFFVTPGPLGIIEQVGDLARNVYFFGYTWQWDRLPEKAPMCLAYFKKNNRDPRTSPVDMYQVGWGWGMTAAGAVRMAVKDVGPDKVTGEAFYNALTHMKNYDFGGVGVKMTFSEKKRFGADSVILQRLNDRKINLVGEIPCPNLTQFVE